MRDLGVMSPENNSVKWRLGLALCLSVIFIADRSGAEPYLAIRTGLKCIVCHVNPSGGGKRTEFGNIYAQTKLARKYIRTAPSAPPPPPGAIEEDLTDTFLDGMEAARGAQSNGLSQEELADLAFWLGSLNEQVSIGGDVRARANVTMIPHQDDNAGFEVEEALLYVELTLIPERLTFYLDEKVAPGGVSNREAYALLRSPSGRSYLKAGQMFLPYGFRLEDDTAFIRQVPGINYNTPDVGLEWGYEPGRWSFTVALTNGSAGGSENDRGKQYSLRASYIRPGWRLGTSGNFNDAGADERRMANIFGGFQTGRITWLGEVDYIVDEALGGREQGVGLVEVNALITKGHNLKLTYEYFDPNRDISEDQRDRVSIQWAAFPTQFTQIRLGYRINDGIPQDDLQNTEELFLQLHVFF